MKKNLILIGIIIIVVAIIAVVILTRPEKINYQETDKDVVLSLEDEITDDSVWCGTFNLIWNDLKNDLAKQDIVFNPQLKIVENLNKGTFSVNNISEDSYYKIYGNPTLELKEKIEKAIKDKFNETSDILDDFEWSNANPKDYFLYVMLKKDFEFSKEFTELANAKFKDVDNVKYFGIDAKTDESVREQVKVLYYENEDNFAFKITTKTNDEVIISKGLTETTFKEIYESIKDKTDKYIGNSSFGDSDTLKVPNISFKLKKEFKDLEEKPFLFANGDEYVIETAIQTIEFDLDKKGGRIKSEAGMGVKNTSVSEPGTPRNFNVDDTFVIFLQETGEELPYFAAKISNITNVQ